MKNKAYIIGITLTATTLLLATACSNELSQDPGNDDGNSIGTPITLSATLPSGGTNPTDGTPRADTRIYNQDNGKSGIITYWNTGDAFRLYTGTNPITGAGVSYDTKHAGEFTATDVSLGNAQQAEFSGILTATDGDGNYTAYYPSAHFPEDPTAGAAPVISLTGQVQTFNNDMKHMEAYNFMRADITDNLAGKIQFKPLLAMLTFKFTMPASFEGTPTELKMKVTGMTRAEKNNVFTDQLFYNSTDGYGNTDELTLAFKNITVSDDKTLTAYMLVAPFNLTIAAPSGSGESHTLTISLATSEGIIYTCNYSIAGTKSYEAGHRYTATIAADDWKSNGSNVTGPGLGGGTNL